MAIRKTVSTPVYWLSEGMTVQTQIKTRELVTVTKIEKRGTKRVSWRITWSDGKVTSHGSRATFAVVSS